MIPRHTNEEVCEFCGEPLINNHCYNSQCSAYDPISQYFECPTEDEIKKDEESLKNRVELELSKPIVSGDLPF